MYGYGKDCLILIPFRLPQISCFTLSLKCFCSDSDNCPVMEIGRLASVPPPTEGRSSPTNTPVSLPSSCVLLSFVWFYTFFSSGQALRPALSWCSAYTSVSEGVFLMYPWSELCSTSTCSSTILFSQVLFCLTFFSVHHTVWHTVSSEQLLSRAHPRSIFSH